MKNLLTFLPLAFYCFSGFCQTERALVSFDALELTQSSIKGANHKHVYISSQEGDIPLDNPTPFIAYSVVWESTSAQIDPKFKISLFSDAESESLVQSIAPDSHAKQTASRHTSQLYFADKEMKSFRIRWEADARLEHLEIHFFSPGKSEVNVSPVKPISTRNACPCPQPEYLDRDGWCPAGNCPPDATPVTTNVTHLIVHHSAGTNSSTDWAATVRSIWDFHVNVNGWDDIGYNWLVDPDGVLYEGRGDNRLGAHFCGQNGGTMGVCVLGDFTNITPSPDAYGRLEDLLSWKICDIAADPLGSSFHASSGEVLMHISGHRDDCPTACPGDSFYPTFDALRTGVDEAIESECNGVLIEAPSELTAEANGFTSIELNWLDNSFNETEFTLERSVSFNNNFQAIATLPAESTSYTDTDLQSSTGYFYRIKADTSSFSSLYSNEAFAATSFSAVNDELLDNGSILLFPNPTSHNMTLSIENQWIGRISTTLFDALGRPAAPLKSFQKLNNVFRTELELGNLPTGVFWLKIEQENGEVAWKKIIKK